ncbi:hypothetical protein GGI25_001430 [Coemansia spiralis]|uniref:LIM zinc-binding domain-containing protein n=1 Tax=Coemansia spiralis TaxID=417178 RepID=A0A9W8L014_9FUNG|nr:hypothetical protein GGI25_001430 [Coemansia spiralis]
MRVPFLERSVRDSTALPTMTCSQCSQEVHIRQIGMHQCAEQPQVPELPDMKSRGLSSFFDAEPSTRSAPRYNTQDTRKAVESRMFPSSYKPSLQLLEDPDEFDFDEMLNNAAAYRAMSSESLVVSPGPRRIPDFNSSNSSISLDALASGLSPLGLNTNQQMALDGPSDAHSVAAQKKVASSAATQQNSLMQKMAAVSTPTDAPLAASVPSEVVSPVSDSSDSAFTLSSVSSPVQPVPPMRTGSAIAPSTPVPVQPVPLTRTGSATVPSAPAPMQMQRGKSSSSSIGGAQEGAVRADETSHHHHHPHPHHHQQQQKQQQRHVQEQADIQQQTDNGGHKGPSAHSPTVTTTTLRRLETGRDNGSISSSLPIGGMLKARPGGSAARQQGSPTSPMHSAGSAHSDRHSPTDSQIRISARRTNAQGIDSPTFSSPLNDTQYSSLTTPRAIEDPRKLARTTTAPPTVSMRPPNTPHANPLDLLASLVPNAKTAVPHINTQLGKAPKSGPRSAKSLKTAKLDSLLDDLMGEMHMLNVSTESDRDSMVSTASIGHSPFEANPLRGRFDSTVSTASTSSTLSNGAKRQLHCTVCGTGISMGRNAVVRSSGLRSDIPPAVQGIEHQGRVYCVRDYRRQLSVCRGCQRPCDPASKDTVSALDAWWHRACFNCQECHKPFPDKSFYVFEHRPFCRYHYHKLNRSLCVACEEPIEGPCAQVLEGRFHPECFACHHCGDALRDVYYSLDGRFFCEAHVHQHRASRSVNKRMTVFGHV